MIEREGERNFRGSGFVGMMMGTSSLHAMYSCIYVCMYDS